MRWGGIQVRGNLKKIIVAKRAIGTREEGQRGQSKGLGWET